MQLVNKKFDILLERITQVIIQAKNNFKRDPIDLNSDTGSPLSSSELIYSMFQLM